MASGDGQQVSVGVSACRRAGEIAAAAGSGERAAVTRRHFSISALLALRSSRGQRGANGIRASDAPRARDGSVYVRPLAAEDDSRTTRSALVSLSLLRSSDTADRVDYF